MPDGSGLVELTRQRERTVVTRLVARSPLKLLTPRTAGARAAVVIASSYGGGLVAGDEVSVEINLGSEATAYFGTQASTKVYRSLSGRGCRQQLTVTAAEDAAIAVLPDPVVPFAGSRYEQRQRFDLHPAASLILLDWFTAGRSARGERWAFESYAARNDIYVGERHLLADAVRLDSGLSPIDAPHRTGRFGCFATLVLVGPRLAKSASMLLDWVQQQPLTRAGDLAFSASPLGDGGAILRAAGAGAETVGHWLRERLSGIVGIFLDEDPWRRKF